jgi:hypothetical protein
MKNKTKNIAFDFNQFEKIEDIIFLDEPILSHLKRNDKHFLFYLVDTIEESDIYLLFEINEELIFEYLTKRITLKKLILDNKNISYLIEQDFNGNITNIDITESQFIDENYLPHEDSLLEYDPSEKSYYYNFIKEFEAKSYLTSLRNKAFYVKFAPTNTKYSDTIGLNELASSLLSNLSLSFKNFLKADFFLEFKEHRTDKNKLSNTFNKLLPDLDFRMVDLKYGSFEVGLAVDSLMKGSIEDKEIKDWAIDVGYKYKKLVLDEDYDDKTVNNILESYDEKDRKKIFNPIFKITENPNFSLQIKDSNKSKYSTIRIKDKSVIEKIIPPISYLNEIEDNKEYEIFQVTTVRDKNNLSKVIKLENTLFNLTDKTEVILNNKNFEKYGYKLDLEISIPLNITTEKDSIILSAQYDNVDFNIVYHSDKIDDGIKKITSNIYEYILNRE